MAALNVNVQELNQTILCFAETIYRFNGVWEGPDPLTPLISLFLIQLALSMAVIHLLVYLLKPFNQPPFVAELLGGILMGPSALGRISAYKKMVFPYYSLKVLEPMAHFAIVYYAFLVGLKMDVKAILRTGPKALKVAVAGTIVPFCLGSVVYIPLVWKRPPSETVGFIFVGGALTVTGFSVLTKILDKQQMIHTEIGKTAMASALISDMGSWAFLALALAASGSEKNLHWSLISTTAFGLLCVYYVRPALGWIIRKTPEGQGYSEFYICSILTGMALSGVITDSCGTHPMIGAFMFGLVIPNEVLEATLVDRLEDFVVGILMPVYFVVCGLRTNIDAISHNLAISLVSIALACTVKVLSALSVSCFTDFPAKEAVAVGLLSNAKSIMVLIILESGHLQKALATDTYSTMVVAVLLMTMTATPSAIWYRPVQNTMPYRRRTIQKAKTEEELRILSCIYNTRNVPAIINLLKTSNATARSPISVFALQLVELVGRASTMLVVHNTRKAGPRNPSHIEAQADQIIAAFDNYELGSEGVRTQALTARCPIATMDEDICNIAKEKRAAFIIIPFHKQQTIDGEMEDVSPSIRSVNEGVLANAPCSVGILVDRGFAESHDRAHNIAVLFFGGPDDREALSYAWRMADTTNVRLTLVRFISSMDAVEEEEPTEPSDRNHVALQVDSDTEKILDDDYLNKFKTASESNKSLLYCELVLHDEEEAIKAIKSMDEHKYNLYIVGKGRGVVSPLTSGLADWCDCPELGPIGDLLVTSEFESSFSVLIVQQYVKMNKMRDGSIRSSSSVNYGEEVAMRPSVTGSDVFDDYGSFRRWEHDD